MLLVIVFIFGFASYSTTSETDFLGGPNETYSGAEAEAVLLGYGDITLPAGTEVIGFLDGGFQDRFIQAKLSVPADQVDALLTSFGTSRPSMIVTGPNQFPVDLPWWDIDTHETLLQGEVTYGHFPFASVSIVPDPQNPDRVLFYLSAFET